MTSADSDLDEDLIGRVKNNDTVAFELFAARYQESLQRHIFSLLRDHEATNDILQEVLLRLWTHAEQWNGRGNVKSWLFRIATNTALNHLRTVKRRRQQPLELPTDPFNEDGEGPTPDWLIDHSAVEPGFLLEQAESQALFRSLVDGLPEEKREVFQLAHEAEMDIRAIALKLQIPPGTVKSRLHYANKRLAREWTDLEKKWEKS